MRRWLPGRERVFVADSSFAVIILLKRVSELKGVSLITRLSLDAVLYDPAPERRPAQQGRPRLKGARRPTLQHLLNQPQLTWRQLSIKNWYGGRERRVEVCTDTTVWYHTAMPPVQIRWVLIRDPQGQFDPQALLWTNLAHTPKQILQWFVRRWTLEVTFEETRAPIWALRLNDSGTT